MTPWTEMKSFPQFFRTRQIEAAPTSAAVEGFKANLVFKEIEKKLEEVSNIYLKYHQEDPEARGGAYRFQVLHEVVQLKIYIILSSIECIFDI